MKLDTLVSYCDSLYAHPAADFCRQVMSLPKDIRRVLLTYDVGELGLDVLRTEPDLIISHHPLKEPYTPHILRQHGISLSVYHNVMDGHPEIGHNTLIVKELQRVLPLRYEAPFGHVRGYWYGQQVSAPTRMRLNEVIKAGETVLGTPVKEVHEYKGTTCKRLAIFCGYAGDSVVVQCLESGVDTLITGEVDLNRAHELLMARLIEEHMDYPVMREVSKRAREMLRLNILCFGHEETELMGLAALREKILSQFALDVSVVRCA